MKVVITPQGGVKNPYIRLLTDSLMEAGVEVHLSRSHRFVLWQAVREYGRPDIIHIQWQHSFLTAPRLPRAMFNSFRFFLQLLTLRLLGVRFVWTVHNVINHEKVLARWELLMCRLLARLVDRIMVHCETAVSIVSAAYSVAPERFSVTPQGHYANHYPPAPDKEEARRKLSLPAEARVFLFFGQMRAYKGLDRLLDEFAALETQDVRLILAGVPKPALLRHSLAAQAARDPRVQTRFEFIPDDQLVTLLSASDLVVLPYRDSLTSGVATLAMSYGRAILAPRIGCTGEFAAEAAILYEPQAPDGLQKALASALQAPLTAMGAAARHHALRSPWALTGTKTVIAYQSVLHHKQRTEIRQVTDITK